MIQISKSNLITCLFLISAGKAAGLGHLSRALVAAHTLKKNLENIEISFITVGEQIPKGLMSDFDCISINTLDVDFIKNEFLRLPPNLLIIDVYKQELDQKFKPLICKLRSKGVKVVAIDGLSGFEHEIDLIYIPSFYNKKSAMIDGQKAKTIYGWECFLLHEASVDKKTSNTNTRILVLTGGSDVNGLGKIWPRLLNELNIDEPVTIDWVVGPYSEMPQIPMNAKYKFKIHQSPSGLGDLMKNADFALTLYGVSFFELLRCRVPTVVYVGKSKTFETEALKEEMVAVVAEELHQAVELLRDLILDKEKSNNLSHNGWRRLKKANGHKFALEIMKLL